jgi:hypothetical protein
VAPPTLTSFVDRLYAGSLDSFTATRKALAAELRATGAIDEAKRLATMPKPSRSAWALGQVARRHAAELRAFLEATERVREAQTRAVKERDSAAIRDAGRAFNASIAELVTLAARILEEAGAPATAQQRRAIAQTLRAVPFATPDEVGELTRGSLAKDLEPSSDFGVFGHVPRMATPEEAPAAPKTRRDSRAEDEVRRREQEAARQAAAEARRRERELAELSTAAEVAEREATRLEEASREAARRARDLEAQAREARLVAGRARAAFNDAARRR